MSQWVGCSKFIHLIHSHLAADPQNFIQIYAQLLELLLLADTHIKQ